MVTITTETIIVIWISSVVGAILSHYLPKEVFKITNNKFLNIFLTAIILGLGILFITLLGFKLLKIID